jgi:SAM-dependent methyltransferase
MTPKEPTTKKSLPMSVGKRLATAILLVLMLVLIARLGCDTWRGAGFRLGGSEMPRLREALTLRPGMSVADVGAGGGELTVALAAEVGPSGQVFSTDIDPKALEQIRARVAAAALRNVTVVQAYASDTGLPMNCCDAMVLPCAPAAFSRSSTFRRRFPGCGHGRRKVSRGIGTGTAWRPASWSTKSPPAASSS